MKQGDQYKHLMERGGKEEVLLYSSIIDFSIQWMMRDIMDAINKTIEEVKKEKGYTEKERNDMMDVFLKKFMEHSKPPTLEK